MSGVLRAASLLDEARKQEQQKGRAFSAALLI